jgi:atypical dual specificity phosphatase
MDRIRDNIYVGDKEEAGKRNRLDLHDIVHVVTLCDEATDYTTVHHPIVDGENDQAEFDRAVEIVSEAMRQEQNVLVHCASGMSRSVTVVATAIAAADEITFEKGLEIVADQRTKANPHPDIVTHAERHLPQEK